MNKDIKKLKKIIFREQGSFNSNREDFFERIGLILVDDFEKYDEDWEKTKIFATTGGDGVHFSFLGEKIVLTVPGGFIKNIIIANNFDDFISIGTKCGFFYLEGLAYDFKDTINSYYNKGKDGPHEISEDEYYKSNLLKKEFDIKNYIENLESYLIKLNPDINLLKIDYNYKK